MQVYSFLPKVCRSHSGEEQNNLTALQNTLLGKTMISSNIASRLASSVWALGGMILPGIVGLTAVCPSPVLD